MPHRLPHTYGGTCAATTSTIVKQAFDHPSAVMAFSSLIYLEQQMFFVKAFSNNDNPSSNHRWTRHID
jgi:hypothetical protein